MSISVVVIAHNEELWIEKCLNSLENQTQKPDEIILVLHNCNDCTESIAQKFNITLIETDESGGPIIARARGIEKATGDIICCTDGDCWFEPNWVKNITFPLMENPEISIVGGYTEIRNNLFLKFSSWYQFILNRKILKIKKTNFVWGSNFAFRKNDYIEIGGFIPFLQIHQDLELNYWAEDLYISLAFQKIGKIFFATDAIVYTYLPPEKESLQSQSIIIPKQKEDNQKLFNFFK